MNHDTEPEQFALLQRQAIDLVLERFGGKAPRYGFFPIHPAVHSLQVGGDLIRYGFPLEVCLAGYCHNLEKETWYDLSRVAEQFGDQVASYTEMCSLGPAFEDANTHDEGGEDNLFIRIRDFTEKTKDMGPLAIKCVESMDLVRGAKYCPVSWAPKRLKRAKRWLALARPYLTESHRDLVLDFEEVIRREHLRINFPISSENHKIALS